MAERTKTLATVFCATSLPQWPIPVFQISILTEISVFERSSFCHLRGLLFKRFVVGVHVGSMGYGDPSLTTIHHFQDVFVHFFSMGKFWTKIQFFYFYLGRGLLILGRLLKNEHEV